jgi:hypothetical protein
MNVRKLGVVAALAVLVGGVGCRSMYYGMWEKLGREKRHLLKSNVEEAQEEQAEASEQFKDVLTRLKELSGFDGGELEDVYRKLKGDYEDCERRAQAVRERIGDVEQVADDMFKEWENEIGQISNPEFRRKSRDALQSTRQRYDRLVTIMNQAESRMEPVLVQLRDYVLYLKHNLNAKAIGSLRGEVDRIEADVERLVADMNASIQEADMFLRELE